MLNVPNIPSLDFYIAVVFQRKFKIGIKKFKENLFALFKLYFTNKIGCFIYVFNYVCSSGQNEFNVF